MTHTKIPKIPPVLRIEPASACNFRCIHCPTGLGLNDSIGIMRWRTFERILKIIKNYKFRVIVMYHGGEPLLNKNFTSMVSRIKPFATKLVKTVSNGSMLSESLALDLIKSDLDMIEFSLDGTSLEENNRIRIGCNFQEVAQNIIEFIKLRNSMGSIKPEVFISNVQIPKEETDTSQIEVPEYLLEAFAKVREYIEYKLTYSLIWPEMPLRQEDKKPTYNFCDHVVSTMTIRWNGDVVPCCYDLTSQMVMGNILEEELELIWSNNRYQKLREEIENLSPPQLCKNCPVLFPNTFMLEKDTRE